MSFTSPWRVIITLPGFKSRCTRPRAWTYFERTRKLTQNRPHSRLGQPPARDHQPLEIDALTELHHEEIGVERREQPLQVRDVLMVQALQDLSLLMEARERAGVVDQPVAHHLERHKFAGGLVLRSVHDGHAAAPHAAKNPKSFHFLATEPVVSALSQSIGDELREHHAELEMTRRQPVECGGRNEQRPDG